MVILRDNGRVRYSRNILLRASTYDIVSTYTVLHLREIKTSKREIKRWMMVHITNNPGDDDGYRHKNDLLSDIYMTLVMEDCFRIFYDNRIK